MLKFKYILFMSLFCLSCFSAAEAAQLSVKWSGLQKVPNTYKIYVSKTSGIYDFTKPNTEVPGTLNTTVITNLDDNIPYYFVVKAFSNFEESIPTKEVSAIPISTNPTQSISLVFSSTWSNRKVFEYIGTTNKKVTVSWQSVSNVNGYEVRLVNLDRNSEVMLSNGKVSTNSITFSLPKTGHYIVKVRSQRNNYTELSDWAYSNIPGDAIVDNETAGWCIYGTVAQPGTIIIQ